MGKPITTVRQALNHYKKNGVTIVKNEGGYQLTSMGGYTWHCQSDEVLIKYADQSANPPKCRSLVGELTEMFWKRR